MPVLSCNYPSLKGDFTRTGKQTLWCIQRWAELIAGILSQRLIFPDCQEEMNQLVGSLEFDVAIPIYRWWWPAMRTTMTSLGWQGEQWLVLLHKIERMSSIWALYQLRSACWIFFLLLSSVDTVLFDMRGLVWRHRHIWREQVVRWWHLRNTSFESICSCRIELNVCWDPAALTIVMSNLGMISFYCLCDPAFFGIDGGAFILLVTEDE